MTHDIGELVNLDRIHTDLGRLVDEAIDLGLGHAYVARLTEAMPIVMRVHRERERRTPNGTQ
jgi:hypothetical protein